VFAPRDAGAASPHLKMAFVDVRSELEFLRTPGTAENAQVHVAIRRISAVILQWAVGLNDGQHAPSNVRRDAIKQIE
jgi:hypothetical protein